MKVSAIYSSPLLKSTFKFASENSALFVAGTSFALSTLVRPLAILSTPNTNKENKKYAITKSITSKMVDMGLTFLITAPFSKALKNIEQNPTKFLKEETIDNLKGSAKSLESSKDYRLASQLFKLGVGLAIAAPKQLLTSNLIPVVLSKIFPKKDKKENQTSKTQINFSNFPDTFEKFKKEPSFKGKIDDKLSVAIGKAMDKQEIQDFSKKFSNTKFEQHLISLTDILSTLFFASMVKKNKKIEEERKKPLIYNSLISTGLCLTLGYGLNELSEKPTQKFVEKFKEVNKNSPDLDKYLNGIKVVKPALVFGLIYYTIIPVISTYLADRVAKNNRKAKNLTN